MENEMSVTVGVPEAVEREARERMAAVGIADPSEQQWHDFLCAHLTGVTFDRPEVEGEEPPETR